jgi:hypothetical protein
MDVPPTFDVTSAEKLEMTKFFIAESFRAPSDLSLHPQVGPNNFQVEVVQRILPQSDHDQAKSDAIVGST